MTNFITINNLPSNNIFTISTKKVGFFNVSFCVTMSNEPFFEIFSICTPKLSKKSTYFKTSENNHLLTVSLSDILEVDLPSVPGTSR